MATNFIRSGLLANKKNKKGKLTTTTTNENMQRKLCTFKWEMK